MKSNEYPTHVRKEMYRKLKRFALMAQGDTAEHDTEGAFALETLLELCEERLSEMEEIL